MKAEHRCVAQALLLHAPGAKANCTENVPLVQMLHANFHEPHMSFRAHRARGAQVCSVVAWPCPAFCSSGACRAGCILYAIRSTLRPRTEGGADPRAAVKADEKSLRFVYSTGLRAYRMGPSRPGTGSYPLWEEDVECHPLPCKAQAAKQQQKALQ